ncbi:uncharacterized protein LOC116931806 [Daphnia magna]|uniref:uncharacterized protein LOC116931806 n=1 Tax=Daphnia magna TaxID=35525 RepID=UPI001E1BA014|nr:uncharacterized protein LOC116931806 [Daphnia magna]XP_045026114.1 uncharacterized protein LOC116931806 [Daphnia magna]XP_045026115.1 uncharacterized protein LOC116931806 [Daphnia magna]
MASNSFFSDDDLEEDGRFDNHQTSVVIGKNLKRSFQHLRGKKKKSVRYIPGPNKPPHNRKTMESRIASLKYLINQLFHEDNCHIVAFIAQENEVKWSPDLILPENVPAPILKRTKEGKKNLGPILEFVETPEVEAAKKLWIDIYNEKQAIREKTPEWIQAKYERLETIRSKREEIKRKQLEAANSTVTNLSSISFSVQESETLPSNIISPDNNLRFLGGESIIAEETANNAELSHQLPLPNEMASSSSRATPPINYAKKRRSQEIDKVFSWRGKMYFWCPFAKPSAKYVIAASFPKDARVINLPEDPANLTSCYVDE